MINDIVINIPGKIVIPGDLIFQTFSIFISAYLVAGAYIAALLLIHDESTEGESFGFKFLIFLILMAGWPFMAATGHLFFMHDEEYWSSLENEPEDESEDESEEESEDDSDED